MACDKLAKIRENLSKNVPVEENVKNIESDLTLTRDETNEMTINSYEFQGAPVRECINMWITGTSDPT